MFSLCANMLWNHLPVPGGIYAQDPSMLDDFAVIFGEVAAAQEEEHKRQMAKTKQN